MNANTIAAIVVALLIGFPLTVLYINTKRFTEYRREVKWKMIGLKNTLREKDAELMAINEACFILELVDHFNFLILLKLETKHLGRIVKPALLEDRLYEVIVLSLSNTYGIDVLKIRSVYPSVTPELMEYTLARSKDVLTETTSDLSHLCPESFTIELRDRTFNLVPIIDNLVTKLVKQPTVTNVY